MNSEIVSKIYNKSLDILSRREHSSDELEKKLFQKFESKEDIKKVIYKLKENNLINDRRFSEFYVIARKRKGFGPKKILFELEQKGVKSSVSIEIINNEGGWIEAAKKVFTKKFGNKQESDTKTILKQKSFLLNRGFSFKEIESVFLNDML